MKLSHEFQNLSPKDFEAAWTSPSNIAFVKYWGKKGHQLPANPSLSMTLKECTTKTKVFFRPSDSLTVDLFLDGVREEKFAQKIKNHLVSLTEFPWLVNHSLTIETQNTFPHGTGIASSASGLSAFALCLTEYLFHLSGIKDDFFKVASHLSRLFSGSACRSVYGGFTTWGDESDYHATPIEVNKELQDLRDTILVIDETEKKVSSTSGHGRMMQHPFAESRFLQARNHFNLMTKALKVGDIHLMGDILESEALSLHAMMMTSPKPYILIKPKTLMAMEMIRVFREETKLPLYFTLDAGPNLHLIYPSTHLNKIQTFIQHELSPLALKVIEDERGEGPRKFSC
jgi:diphosphomevalonate decarboxylase